MCLPPSSPRLHPVSCLSPTVTVARRLTHSLPRTLSRVECHSQIRFAPAPACGGCCRCCLDVSERANTPCRMVSSHQMCALAKRGVADPMVTSPGVPDRARASGTGLTPKLCCRTPGGADHQPQNSKSRFVYLNSLGIQEIEVRNGWSISLGFWVRVVHWAACSAPSYEPEADESSTHGRSVVCLYPELFS